MRHRASPHREVGMKKLCLLTRLCLLAFALTVSAIAIDGSRPAHARQETSLNGYAPGTIVVRTGARRLYYVTGGGRAISYPVGVGRAGKTWTGSTFITSIRLRPDWSPPAEIRRDKPSLPHVIPGGSPRNPMGAAALLLAKGEYAIHGTNAPGSIGGFVSYGCIRMHNADIMHLIQRVHMGTPVVVTR
ncbi:MAG: L,D-transpeptidase [Pseudorhodoplanes sp.]|nr:L,D-transpeptidase [Pseudorhodoplanes sp.]